MFKLLFLALFLTTALVSCREQTEEEKLIEEMKAEGADIKVKGEEGDRKIKMETDNKEVKIKEDDDETKIKVKIENDDN